MRKVVITAAFLALLASFTGGCVPERFPDSPVFDTVAIANECMCWTPTTEDISRFESEVLLGKPPPVVEYGDISHTGQGLPAPLESYKRVYAGVIVNLTCIHSVADGPDNTPFSDGEWIPKDACPTGFRPYKMLTGTLEKLGPQESPSVEISSDGKAPTLTGSGCATSGYPFWFPILKCRQ